MSKKYKQKLACHMRVRDSYYEYDIYTMDDKRIARRTSILSGHPREEVSDVLVSVADPEDKFDNTDSTDGKGAVAFLDRLAGVS